MAKRTLALFLAFILAAASLSATELAEAQLAAAARRWLNENALFWPGATPEVASVERLRDGAGQALPMVGFAIAPEGYLVMGADTRLPAVLAFGCQGRLDAVLDEDHPLAALLLARGRRYQALLEETATPATRGGDSAVGPGPDAGYWRHLLGEASATAATRAPAADPTPAEIVQDNFLTTTWHQNHPFNLLCPTDSNGLRSPTGCVATSFAQVLNYYRWPTYGCGEEVTHEDTEGATTARITTALRRGYDWEAMNGELSANAADPSTPGDYAVAKLMVELGAIAGMNWEAGASSASLKKPCQALSEKLYYRPVSWYATIHYNGAEYVEDPAEIYAMLPDEMIARRPVILEIPGHAFVACGLAHVGGQDYYYMNLGWGAKWATDADALLGWYRLDDGYHGSVVQSAVIGIEPAPVPIIRPVAPVQGPSFTLEWDFPQWHAEAATAFKVMVGDAEPVILGPEARSLELSDLAPGEVSIAVAAQIGGEWQEASVPVQVTVQEEAPMPLVLEVVSAPQELLMDVPVVVTLAANQELAQVTVVSDHEDIISVAPEAVSIEDGNTVSITLMAAGAGRCTLWVDAVATAGAVSSISIQLEATRTEKLVWVTTEEEAVARAQAEDKLILVVFAYSDDDAMRQLMAEYSEQESIKALAADYMVPWYCTIPEHTSAAVQNSPFWKYAHKFRIRKPGEANLFWSVQLPQLALLRVNGDNLEQVRFCYERGHLSDGKEVADIPGVQSKEQEEYWLEYLSFYTYPEVLTAFLNLFDDSEYYSHVEGVARRYSIAAEGCTAPARAGAGATIIATAILPENAMPSDYRITWSSEPAVEFEVDGVNAAFTMPEEDIAVTCTTVKRTYAVAGDGCTAVPAMAAPGDLVALTAILPDGVTAEDCAEFPVEWSCDQDGIELEVAEDGLSATFVVPDGTPNINVTATVPEMVQFELGQLPAGWNALVLAMEPNAATVEALGDSAAYKVDSAMALESVGPCYTGFDGPEGLAPGRLCWLYLRHASPEEPLVVRGRAVPVALPTGAAWVPYGVNAAVAVPAGYEAKAWNGTRFEAVTGDLQPGLGYFIHRK